MATHSSILAWEILMDRGDWYAASPGESGLVSRGSQGLRSPLESRRGSLGAPERPQGSPPPLPVGERTRDCSPGHAGKEGPQLARTGAQGASERRGILWRWRGPSGLRWVWRNGRGPHLEGRQAPHLRLFSPLDRDRRGESPAPPSSRAEGLLFLHGLESNPGSSLQTEEEAGLP